MDEKEEAVRKLFDAFDEVGLIVISVEALREIVEEKVPNIKVTIRDVDYVTYANFIREMRAASEVISRLVVALKDHHEGTSTTRPFAETYRRDKSLLIEASAYWASLKDLIR